MAKLEIYTDNNLHVFFCIGCGYNHAFDSRWTFNNNFENPTFTPSLLVNKDMKGQRCHLFITDGKIIYLNDCDHSMAGKTVDMVDIDTIE